MIVWNVPEVIPFVASLAGCAPDFGNCRTAAVVKDRQIIAGFVFHNWSPENGVIEVSAGATDPRWATRENIKELLGYVFSVAQTCVARSHEDNKRARRLWRSFGAQEFILPRMRGRTASEALTLLTDDAWAESKYMRPKHGQEQSTVAA